MMKRYYPGRQEGSLPGRIQCHTDCHHVARLTQASAIDLTTPVAFGSIFSPSICLFAQERRDIQRIDPG